MSNEWKDIRDEFPSQIGKLYLVRATRDEFTIFYLCKLFDLGGTVELTGYSPFDRRFAHFEPKDQPIVRDLDLQSDEDRPSIVWKELDTN
jgi:hypothetical protein